MRIVKSVIAVAICFLVNALRGELGMVFYSQLAALWCIQMYRSNTTKNAIQRIIGTCVGALYGLIYLLLFPHLISVIKSVFWVETIMVSLSLLFVLYTTVLLKKNQASYFSCVVFLSIAINHAHDVVPYLFVWNRFLDTMIGIAIGILVNDIRICINPDKETLFVSGLDDTILNIDESLSPFSKVELNRMIDSGLKFTISTIRTPASLIDPVKDIRLKLPVIAMNGAVLYDTQKNSFIKITSIPIDLSNQLMDIILDSGLCWYANVIVDDVLLIYYTRNDDDINTKLVNDLKVSPYRNYIERPLPKNEDVVYLQMDNVEFAFARFCNAFYGYPTNILNTIGITGTNGKTTIAWIIRSIVARFNKCGYIGTMGYCYDENLLNSKLNLTTPKSDELFRIAKEMIDNGCKTLVLEASSEGLYTHRLDDVNFTTAVFNNLSQDHMDVHGNMESYFESKLLLFRMLKEEQ